jgi:hypothetical protein
MVIEKKYYDIAQRELEEMQREINEEKAQMSEEEIPERSIPPITFVFSPNLSVSEIWIGEPLPIKLF